MAGSKVFIWKQDPQKFDQAETLFRVGKYLTSLLLVSIWKGPEDNATFADIAGKMLELEPDPGKKDIIREQFRKREILDAPKGLTGIRPQMLSWEKCCGTMHLKEHTSVFEQNVKAALKKS